MRAIDLDREHRARRLERERRQRAIQWAAWVAAGLVMVGGLWAALRAEQHRTGCLCPCECREPVYVYPHVRALPTYRAR